MDGQATKWIPCAFEQMPDPRDSNHRHKLIDILSIALFAIICGADDWVAVVAYGRAKQEWLKTFLDLPHGIPSHDTFGDLFARLDPDAFERCFQAWMATVVKLSSGKLVAIDGKSLRRSFEHGWDKSGMAHMVSAFVQGNSMVFAQVKANGKGQELSAIDRLLDMLDLNGAVVSIDALGCQKEIARKIQQKNGKYLLQVKDNQPTLHSRISRNMDDCIRDNFKDQCFDYFGETDGDHGRIETRKVWACWDVKLLKELAADWVDIRCMIAVERTRELLGVKSIERHYYISSLDSRSSAQSIAGYVRGHWSVENNLHWQLDISFDEDNRRIRKGHGPENFSRLCRIALNLLKKETSQKTGIKTKRKSCGWNNDYLLKVVMG